MCFPKNFANVLKTLVLYYTDATSEIPSKNQNSSTG